MGTQHQCRPRGKITVTAAERLMKMAVDSPDDFMTLAYLKLLSDRHLVIVMMGASIVIATSYI
jgi:hypothetical protein